MINKHVAHLTLLRYFGKLNHITTLLTLSIQTVTNVTKFYVKYGCSLV